MKSFFYLDFFHFTIVGIFRIEVAEEFFVIVVDDRRHRRRRRYRRRRRSLPHRHSRLMSLVQLVQDITIEYNKLLTWKNIFANIDRKGHTGAHSSVAP